MECDKCKGGLVCPTCGCNLFGKDCEWCPPCSKCNGEGYIKEEK